MLQNQEDQNLILIKNYYFNYFINYKFLNDH